MSHPHNENKKDKNKNKKEESPNNIEELCAQILKVKHGNSTPEAINNLSKIFGQLLEINGIENKIVHVELNPKKEQESLETSIKEFLKNAPTDINNFENNLNAIALQNKQNNKELFFNVLNKLSNSSSQVAKKGISLAGMLLTRTKDLRLILGTFAIISEPPTSLEDFDLKTVIKMLKIVGINPKQLSDLLKLYKSINDLIKNSEEYITTQNILAFITVTLAIAVALEIYRNVKSYCETNKINIDDDKINLSEKLEINPNDADNTYDGDTYPDENPNDKKNRKYN